MTEAKVAPESWKLTHYMGIAGTYVVTTCPACNKPFSIRWHHFIARDGTVKPGVECPYNACDFAGTIRLEGWDPHANVQDVDPPPLFPPVARPFDK